MLTGAARCGPMLAAAALVALPWLAGHQGAVVGQPRQGAAAGRQRAAAGLADLTRAGAGQGAGTQIRAAERAQLKSIDAPAAWRMSQGRGVTVGVLDTGVDASVADLSGSVRTGPDYTQGADPPG
jgi:subtilisin family serine protease